MIPVVYNTEHLQQTAKDVMEADISHFPVWWFIHDSPASWSIPKLFTWFLPGSPDADHKYLDS